MPCRTAAPIAGRPPLVNAGPADASVAHAIMLYARKPHVTPRLAGADGVWRAPQHAMPKATRAPPPTRAMTSPGPANADRRRSDATPDGATRSPNPVTISRTPPRLKMRTSQTELFMGSSEMARVYVSRLGCQPRSSLSLRQIPQGLRSFFRTRGSVACGSTL